MTSLVLDPALPPSHPLLLDGRLTEELLPAVGESEKLHFLLKVKENDFRLVEEGVSNVRVWESDRSTEGLAVLAVGIVTKVDTGGVPSAGEARVGTMTSLTLDSFDLLKVKVRALPPSHPLLLDGRAGLLLGSLGRMWCVIKKIVISPGIHHTALNGPADRTSGLVRKHAAGTRTILVRVKGQRLGITLNLSIWITNLLQVHRLRCQAQSSAGRPPPEPSFQSAAVLPSTVPGTSPQLESTAS